MEFMMQMESDSVHIDAWYIQEVATKAAELAFHNKHFQDFLRDTSQTFDVVISEFMETELYAG
jgi:hypothetical protein